MWRPLSGLQVNPHKGVALSQNKVHPTVEIVTEEAYVGVTGGGRGEEEGVGVEGGRSEGNVVV